MGLRHWLQLSLTEGIGPILVQRIVSAAGGAEQACRVDVGFLRQVEGIGPDKSRLIGRTLKEAATLVDQELERCASAGVSLVCPDDGLYPVLLRNIPDPPTVLFMRGNLEPRDLNAMAIVGSRRCSLYGRRTAPSDLDFAARRRRLLPSSRAARAESIPRPIAARSRSRRGERSRS